MSGKLLYVSPSFEHRRQGGREKLSQLHLDCLRNLLGADLDEHLLDGQSRVGWRAVFGRIDGVTREAECAILGRFASGAYDRVFLNGSNLGLLARAIRRRYPAIKIITFCHNVESRFFAGAARTRPRPRALAVLIANFLAERSAARHSSRLVTLSERDSKLFKRMFGRGATDILPMALADRLSANPPLPRVHEPDYLLFVGGGFYANREGIAWYAREVAPSLTIRTLVVGHGMDDLRAELERAPNVELVGAVDDLEPWYLGAKAVIAPIFDGSGMKTKVAEALMFGKRVVGTSEAFSGYEQVAGKVGWQCDTRDEYIDCLNRLATGSPISFDPAMRLIFEENYSMDAARAWLDRIVQPAPS